MMTIRCPFALVVGITLRSESVLVLVVPTNRLTAYTQEANRQLHDGFEGSVSLPDPTGEWNEELVEVSLNCESQRGCSPLSADCDAAWW
mmetsp:Transcript_3696/g.9785  ORF Transcript_3696/g.9785 Transcript_3696/m.9785 type:complete len:89 (-) Transcript_3696:3-269(-)